MTSGAEHAGELLSALADGELAPTERRAVERHLEACDPCRREFEQIERSRRLLFALPEVDPPDDLIEQIVQRRHRMLVRGALAGFAAAIVAAAALLSADLLPDPPVEPQLTAMAADHSTTAVTAPEASTRSSSTSFGSVRVENEIAGFELVAVSETDDVVHAVYRRGQRVVSLFQQEGVVAWETLPADGRRVSVAGRDGWKPADASSTVLDADGIVVVLVGDAGSQEQLAAAVEAPAAPGWWDRAHDAAQLVLGAFDFG